MLDELRDMLTGTDDEQPPTKAELTEKRRDVQARIEEKEAELRRLRSKRAEALAAEDEPGDVGRRIRSLEDEVADLEALDEELAARQREAEAREEAEEYEELLPRLPDLADRFEAAEAELRDARDELERRLIEARRLAFQIERRRPREEGPEAYLEPEAVDRLERIAERLDANVGDLDRLRPPEEPDPDRPRIIYNVTEGVRRYVGDFSKADPRGVRSVTRRESGWDNDTSEAEGIG